MVQLSSVLHKGKKKFIDSLRIFVKGGSGGSGLPRYGGVGGKGGDVYVKASKKQTLDRLLTTFPTKRFVAGHGNHSRMRCILGEPGKDAIISAPIGLSVYADTGGLLGELNEDDSSVLVARGGEGGSPLNQFCGQKGQVHMIRLDLKLIADIGLIGFPNAGKSTLLKSISRASPKVASYPFTTIEPQIGMLEYEDYRQISMADLPGLIEGAHYNLGMGHRFLKHVERTKLLLLVIDIHGFQLSHKYPQRTAFETLILLNKELELYKQELLEKPAVLLINKIDTKVGEAFLPFLLEKIHRISDYLPEVSSDLHPQKIIEFDDIIPISAKTGYQLPFVRERIRKILDLHAEDTAQMREKI